MVKKDGRKGMQGDGKGMVKKDGRKGMQGDGKGMVKKDGRKGTPRDGKGAAQEAGRKASEGVGRVFDANEFFTGPTPRKPFVAKTLELLRDMGSLLAETHESAVESQGAMRDFKAHMEAIEAAQQSLEQAQEKHVAALDDQVAALRADCEQLHVANLKLACAVDCAKERLAEVRAHAAAQRLRKKKLYARMTEADRTLRSALDGAPGDAPFNQRSFWRLVARAAQTLIEQRQRLSERDAAGAP